MAKPKIQVVKATQEHIDALKGNLRDSDIEEIWAMNNTEADYSMQRAFDKSMYCWVALYEEEVVLVFGVVALSMLNKKGVPWLLSSDKINSIGIAAVRRSKEYIQKMLKSFSLLENWVDNRNKISINWLKWCGFHIEKPEPFGADNLLFRRFWLKKGETQNV